MPLREEFRTDGNWLFRYRSYLPLFSLALLAPALVEIADAGAAHRWHWAWQAGCALVAVLGLAVRAHAVGHALPGTSGRNTRGQVARNLNTDGMYSVVRHPLYLGNYLMFLGLVLFIGPWWAPIIASLAYWLYYERIMYAEEEFLRETYGQSYETWASATPPFVPRWSAWVAPGRPMDIGRVVRNENTTLFGAIASFAIIQTLALCADQRALTYDPVWSAILAAGAVVHLSVRAYKKLGRPKRPAARPSSQST